MIETTQSELRSAIYGLLRMIAGYKEWQKVLSAPDEQKSEKLCLVTIAELSVLNSDINNSDPKEISALTRKLKAYQQIRTLEKFCFDEVDWD
jgi:hypothetical protein